MCITSYKLVIQDHQAFRRKKWKYFILDEVSWHYAIKVERKKVKKVMLITISYEMWDLKDTKVIKLAGRMIVG